MNTPVTGSLFDDDSEQPISLVSTLARSKPSSREQRQFQQLVAQIELKREQLKQWQAYSLRYNQRICNELEPLRAKLRTEQQKMVALIDGLLTRPNEGRALGRVQRAKLRALLLNLLEGLLEGTRDEALEAIHDRYSDVSHEQVRQSDLQRTHSFLSEVMGLHVEEDHGATSAEELLRYAYGKLQEGSGAEEREAHGQRSRAGAGRFKANSARAEAEQARREEAAKAIRQSLREVFRKLASALHPDRELDAQARERKTELMQRVNQAYEANDLLTLLGLQLEIEQIDAADLASVSRERLAHYNQILREQRAELDLELERCVAPFRQSLNRPPARSLTIAEVDRDLTAACARLAAAIREMRADLVAFRDPERLRRGLKRFELEPEPDELEELAAFVDLFQAPPGGRPGRRRRRGT
jgi:catechol 2,3-dioxygenase-like lactoylglutathione lyase family enzyme